MAIIPKHTLNEKFENGKKPPQWDFWAWQDSYWHKEEKIPTSAIEGLDAKLLKKADLIDGMVPESQLPFSVVTSEVLALGKVEIIDNKVKLEVHSSGANKVRVKGKLITRIFPNEWPFTPIVGSGIKVLRGYAVKNEDDFFMVEGAELPEMTDPEIPENALQLFRLTISSAGVIVEEETEEVFKYRSDDNWRPLIINTNAGVWLQFGGSGASSFNITVGGSVTAPKIVGLATKVTKNIWNGKESVLYNDSNVAVAILKDQILPTAPNATFINFAEDYILQPKSYNLIKQKGNQIVVVKYGGGSASFPTNGANGNPLVKDTTAPEGVKFSSAIPDAIDAEIVNRAAADLLKEDKLNKSVDVETDKISNVKFPSVKSIYDWTISKLLLKTDKVAGTLQRFAFLKADGNLDGSIPAIGNPAKLMGVNATNTPVTAETIEFKTVSTAIAPPNIIDLDSLGTDRVDCPNLNRIYFKYGAKWGYVNITEV